MGGNFFSRENSQLGLWMLHHSSGLIYLTILEIFSNTSGHSKSCELLAKKIDLVHYFRTFLNRSRTLKFSDILQFLSKFLESWILPFLTNLNIVYAVSISGKVKISSLESCIKYQHCQMPKALSSWTHSRHLVESRSFKTLWNLGQTSVWFCKAKAEKYIEQFWQIHVTTLTNPCINFDKSM